MKSLKYEDFTEGVSDIVIKRKKKKLNNLKKKKSHFFAYLYLFSFVFLGALLGLSLVIKSYSPDIDVSIGNNSNFILNDSDMDVEMKTVDERLKWIQAEDSMPGVSIKSDEKQEKIKKEAIEKQEIAEQIVKPPIPNIREIKEIKEAKEIKEKYTDFKDIPTKEIIAKPKPVLTKVYLGNYPTVEAAANVQKEIESAENGLSPFIKSVNGHYTVQIGSFSDSERAGVLVEKLRAKGYYPKINYEN